MQIVYELRQIFNGVDVVVGWGRDEGHSRLAAPKIGNVWRHLLSRKLPTLTCTTDNYSGQAVGFIRARSDNLPNKGAMNAQGFFLRSCCRC